MAKKGSSVVSASAALKKLKKGNERFLKWKLEHPHLDEARRRKLVGGQSPFAIVLTCSDSRVVPELAFDAGLGDLFTIEVAGNVADYAAIGSIEYAIKHLKTKLVVVMGHQSCGAVGAAIDLYLSTSGSPFIDSLIEAIEPAVAAVKAMHGGKAPADDVVHMNARMMAQRLREEESIFEGTKGVDVVSAYYDLKSGAVTFH